MCSSNLGASPKNILVVGQTPPPYGGQAVMIQSLLEATYSGVRLHHVRMAFAKSLGDLGKVRVGKLLHAVGLVFRIALARIRFRASVLYYPPSGPDLKPVLRDIFVLLAVRWMFSRVIFHFHAAGLSELYGTLPKPIALLYRAAFFYPDVAIELSEHNPRDAAFLKAKRTYRIPNGVEDGFSSFASRERMSNSSCSILFVGLVVESKGILVLLDAMKTLRARNVPVQLSVVGQFASEQFRDDVLRRVSDYGLSSCVFFKGVLTGQAKYEEYWKADVFCFPSFFESESFGLVAVEAMSFGLPIIVSKWRGLQSVIWDGENGFAVPPRDSHSVADRIERFAADPELRRAMGCRGREIFLEKFTLASFQLAVGSCLQSV